jgi:adenine-specific DNA-methyltransferase
MRHRPLRTRLARELRSNMTYTEVRLWLRLKGRQLDGWKFRRQTPIGRYIVDFYCPAARLVIELNGSSHIHERQSEYDEQRRRWLESRGYRVLTYSADSPEQDYLEGVWDAIQLAPAQVPGPPPPARLRHLPATRGGCLVDDLDNAL